VRLNEKTLMYFYITSSVNGRFKVGITENLEKRLLNYATLVPDIKYLVTAQTNFASSIEAGFKHRFKVSRLDIGSALYRRMFKKGEVYPIKYKYLFLLLLHGLHVVREPLVYIYSKNQFLNPRNMKKKYENKYSIQLSNYYFYPKEYVDSYAEKDGSLVWDGKECWFEIGTITEKTNTNAFELNYWDLTKDDLKRISDNIPKNRNVSYFEKEDIYNFRKIFTKGMKQIKKKYTKKNMASHYKWYLESVQNDAKRIIFDRLCKNGVLRPYKIYKSNQTRESYAHKVLRWYPYGDYAYGYCKRMESNDEIKTY